MIQVQNVTKKYPTRSGDVVILDNLTFDLQRGEKIGILGRNGSGKSTLVRLMSGAEAPTSGSIRRGMSVSWPIAFGGAFQPSLTGYDNMKFICRIHNVPIAEKVPFVEEFSELGRYFHEPVRAYSSGMRARLAFAISMVVDFECFLIDEVVAVGDARFHEKCRIELFEKRKDAAMLIVSHDPHFVRDHCDHAAVLEGGRLRTFDSVDAAYDYYNSEVMA
jgi:capsular polysaccharide transport system ATP-binding protein